MGLLDVSVCPNEECQEGILVGKNLTTCPTCGNSIIKMKMGSKELQGLLKAKKEKAPAKPIVSGKALLFSEEMADNEIKTLILQDMRNLQSHEAGSGWMRLGTILSGNSTDQMLGAGFKALIDQNKIIIRQNELLLRAASKEKPASQQA
jgi:hypothetical protein